MSSDASDELAVTTCLNHLVSLLALPSICHGRTPAEIVAISLDALRPLVAYDVGLVCGVAGVDGPMDIVEGFPAPPEIVRQVLCEGAPSAGTGTWVTVPGEMEDLRVASVPLGFLATNGYLVLASRREEFPSHTDLIQLRAAASLVASTVEGAIAREKLEAAREELEEANQAKDEFLAMLGHELRNPLAPIVTAMELLRQRDGVPSRELEIIDRQVLHMRRLVDDLLDVSRIVRGRIDVEIVSIDLAEAISDALEVAHPIIKEKRHTVDVDCPVGTRFVSADRVRCAQVLANLLTNAAKYTEPDGHIQIEASPQADGVLIRVRDNGIGISADTLPRIFSLFEQERRAIDRSQGGLGIGLAIARSLVMLQNGKLWAESPGLGKGSTFYLWLPGAPKRLDAPTADVPAQPPVAGAARRILVVDDNRDATEMLALLLADCGYDVRTALDGVAAIEIAQRFLPDVILLDIGLPVMDGYQVATELRKIPAFRATRLIALTGYGRPDDRRRAEEVGFDRHLVKPIDPDELLREIEASGASAPDFAVDSKS